LSFFSTALLSIFKFFPTFAFFQLHISKTSQTSLDYSDNKSWKEIQISTELEYGLSCLSKNTRAIDGSFAVERPENSNAVDIKKIN
jgi:hypothetical protein